MCLDLRRRCAGKGVITGEEREGKKEREDGEESGEWEMGKLRENER